HAASGDRNVAPLQLEQPTREHRRGEPERIRFACGGARPGDPRGRTKANRTFTATVAGPSRTIAVAYRASAGGTGSDAEARVGEQVRAGVAQVTPRRLASAGTFR